jgi:DNA-binding response OmpR family regulator
MNPLTRPILLVEDRDDDILFFKNAFKHAHLENPLYVVKTGEDALAYLDGTGPFPRFRFPFPSVMMLDLRLPDIHGLDVLQRARFNFNPQQLLIVILTAGHDLPTVRRAYALGADCFVVKPARPEDLLNLVEGFPWHWGSVAASMQQHEPLTVTQSDIKAS